MKARLYTYAHESNGIAVEVIPETTDEEAMLAALWRFGVMEINHSSDNPKSQGFIVRAFRNPPVALKAEEAKG